MTKLSVNINKIATLRNARGGNVPDLLRVASDLEKMGAQGITIHPRPDERHIKYQDARDLSGMVTTEFNIEGNPIQKFINLVLETKPTQVTLVPDTVDAITSDAGWNTVKHKSFLQEVIAQFAQEGIRTSIFVDPIPEMIEGARETGADRIELYTESYAAMYKSDKETAIKPFIESAFLASDLGLGINAGHDLSLENIEYFHNSIPELLEVSIGHALISESLYLGFQATIDSYLKKLK